MFGFASFAQTPFADIGVATGNSYSVEIGEAFTLADTQASNFNAIGSNAETFTFTNAQIASAIFLSTNGESITFADARTSNFNTVGSVAESYAAIDISSGALYVYPSVNESFTFLDILIQRGWIKIDDNQMVTWAQVNNANTVTWTTINDNQVPNWVQIDDSQA